MKTPEQKARKAAYMREWRRKNPEKAKEIQRRDYLRQRELPDHAEKRLKIVRRWRKDNPEKARQQSHRAWVRNRLAMNLHARTKQAVRTGAVTGSAVRDLGCTIEQFRAHIEARFKPGMSWENYGHKGWHFDHIRHLASFNLTDREEFLQAAHYTNIQPLWATENLKKGARP